MRRESISKNSSSLYFATKIDKFLYFTAAITTGCNLYICSCIYLLSLVFAGLMLQSNPENHEHLPLIYFFPHVNSVKTNEVQNETINLTATKLRVINTLGVCCGKSQNSRKNLMCSWHSGFHYKSNLPIYCGQVIIFCLDVLVTMSKTSMVIFKIKSLRGIHQYYFRHCFAGQNFAVIS